MAEFKYIFRQVWDATAQLLQNGPGKIHLRQCYITPALYRIFLEFVKCWLNGILSYSGQYCYIISWSANGQNRELCAPFSLREAPQAPHSFAFDQRPIKLTHRYQPQMTEGNN